MVLVLVLAPVLVPPLVLEALTVMPLRLQSNRLDF